MIWLLKFNRLVPGLAPQNSELSVIEYFVRREVSKKLKEENVEVDNMTYFKIMKQKKCMPNPIGKAMDEWTKEDVARMEKEADEEIEANYPSYFNEY